MKLFFDTITSLTFQEFSENIYVFITENMHNIYCMYVLNIPYTTSAKWDAFYGIMYIMQQHGTVSNRKKVFYMSFKH